MIPPNQDEITAATRVWNAIKADGGTPPSVEEIILSRRAENEAVLAMKAREESAMPAAIEAVKRHLPELRFDRPDAVRRRAEKLISAIGNGTSPRDAARALIWEPSQADARASGGRGLSWAE